VSKLSGKSRAVRGITCILDPMAESTLAKGVTSSFGRSRSTRVVGTGASAGGITACRASFTPLRSRPNLALVVIQHLGREWPSQLVQLVGRSSTLPVCQAVDGERPKRGHIYVAGPDDVLTPERAVLRTRLADGGGRHAGLDTIDAFFESLAHDCGSRAIAVVLSGSGDDGAAGAVCVKRSGGKRLAPSRSTIRNLARQVPVTSSSRPC